MSELADLYQEIILDHSRSPRNLRRPPGHTASAKGDNPLCGDMVTVFLTLDGDRVADAAFEGRGCAISIASASLMTETVKGKTVEEAMAIFRRFQGMVTGKSGIEDRDGGEIDRLSALSGVQSYPMRVKCATMCWHTLSSALARPGADVTTEKA
jgi:nitrogen fixation NifU-like protein